MLIESGLPWVFDPSATPEESLCGRSMGSSPSLIVGSAVKAKNSHALSPLHDPPYPASPLNFESILVKSLSDIKLAIIGLDCVGLRLEVWGLSSFDEGGLNYA
jgi:hypothetical protein